jgi:hypothetical protein
LTASVQVDRLTAAEIELRLADAHLRAVGELADDIDAALRDRDRARSEAQR